MRKAEVQMAEWKNDSNGRYLQIWPKFLKIPKGFKIIKTRDFSKKNHR
jgi:uncharacterized protein YbdZ (MbtH family)